MSAPGAITDLIDRFHRNREDYRAGIYKEAQLRKEFIDPFFLELGWDMDNRSGHAEAYKDVIHEDSIKIGNNPEAPDYCFKIGGTRKFFLEAKKPSVDIKHDTHPAYQLRRYAWSSKLPLSILTDFEEFAVYDCRVKPVHTDNADVARLEYFTYSTYPDHWDWIASVFSKDAILKGSFDWYADTTKGKRGTTEVDAAFLQEIESWRDELARNIALRNPGLTRRELNFAVQRTIDRIIFLRICEDRSIEEYQTLQALNGPNIYPRLVQYFYKADQRYNSGLFHFSREANEAEPPDELSPGLRIDDKPLRNIIKRLYYPESPYEFSVLPADILGQVYEQFLGKVIRLTEGHQAKVEDKPEVKKAGGVFYTPTYIVDYIVKNTVGALLDGKAPKEVEKLKILDPACGSGSFLIGAYQYLLDWHLNYYLDHTPEKWAGGRNPRLVQIADRDWRLTIDERKRILLNNIYGVDIDSQAVEVTKLSLLLKVLEGETKETLDNRLKLFHERALPDLASNIKCGNSLIGPDFYSGEQTSFAFVDEEERYRINVFDWGKEFPEIFKAGGFDAVIGNPPYVRQEMLTEFKEYFQRRYRVYHGIADLYAYFIEKGVSLLRDGGVFSYIVANKWMRANYGEPLRRWLKHSSIEEIVDFGDLRVFAAATTYPCIIRIRKNPLSPTFRAVQVKHLDFTDLGQYVDENGYNARMDLMGDAGWTLANDREKVLLEKIRSKGVPLGEYVKGKIYRGILTGLNEAFVIDGATRDRLITEDPKSAEIIKPFLAGRDIKRYQKPDNDKYLICIPNGWTRIHAGKADPKSWLKQQYSAIADYLEQFREKAEKRYDKGEFWWELRSCDYYEEFEKPKIIYAEIATHGQFTYDVESFYSDTTSYIMSSNSQYLLGLLNSKLFTYGFSKISSEIRGGFFRWKRQYMCPMPIRTIDFSSPADVARHDRMVSLVTAMLDLHTQLAAARTADEKTAIQRLIRATDREIDRLVYELYELTAEEIGIVEGSINDK